MMIKTIVAAAVVSSVVVVYAVTRRHHEPSQFNSIAWDQAVLRKADRLRMEGEPRAVATERVIIVRPEVVGSPSPPPLPKRRQVAEERESNVCTRHGMHKVLTHGGKSWRCRRG